MAQFPYLPLWIDPWAADTSHLNEAELGAYIRLLVLMWRTPGCRIPNDNGWLQRHLRCDKDRLREVYRPIIEEFCRADGNWIVQKRLAKEYVRVFQTKARLSDLAKRPRSKRKGNSSDLQSSALLPPKEERKKEP